MKDIKVAAVCMNAATGETEKNLDKMQGFVSEAAASGAQLVSFPELSVNGYTLRPEVNPYGMLDYERAMARLLEMASKANLILIAGLIEPSGGKKPFITQVVAGPEGFIGVHRKTHLSPPETNSYEPGRELRVFSYGDGALGVQLCYEAHFPEISTVMALMGADILFFPHASPRGNPEEKLESWMRHLPARAFDNGVFVVASNQVGETDEGHSFPGVAVVLGPDGKTLAKYVGVEERMIFARLEGGLSQRIRQHRMKYFLPQRRPALYGRLTSCRH